MRTLFLACTFFIATVSTAQAATVNVVPNTPIANLNGTFSVLVSGTGFPEIGGATLDLRFDPNVVRVSGIYLATGSPFDVSFGTLDNVTGAVLSISILPPPEGVLPSGDFNAFRIDFYGVGGGAASINLIEDGVLKGWIGADGSLISGITYHQANVTVAAVPLPAALWLLLSGLGVLVSNRRFTGAEDS